MSELIKSDITSLLDSWIEAEKNGVQFPVPFDLAWQMAGYATKASAKRALKDLNEGIEFSTQLLKNARAGRSSESINFSLKGVKEFCLLARTPEGKAIRLYFIDAEEKWQLTKQIAPQVAEEVEVLAMKIELAKIEAQKAALEDKTLSLRHYVVTALPKPTADRILGITEVKEIEYRDRIVKDNQVINDGSTVNKTEICRHFSILTKNGKPDYPKLNAILDRLNLPAAAWEETDVVQTNRELKREYLDVLSRALYTAEQRQMFIGEDV
jgi:hypothetical protein